MSSRPRAGANRKGTSREAREQRALQGILRREAAREAAESRERLLEIERARREKRLPAPPPERSRGPARD